MQDFIQDLQYALKRCRDHQKVRIMNASIIVSAPNEDPSFLMKEAEIVINPAEIELEIRADGIFTLCGSIKSANVPQSKTAAAPSTTKVEAPAVTPKKLDSEIFREKMIKRLSRKICWTVKEVAPVLDIPESKIYPLVTDGTLKRATSGRRINITTESLIDWISRNAYAKEEKVEELTEKAVAIPAYAYVQAEMPKHIKKQDAALVKLLRYNTIVECKQFSNTLEIPDITVRGMLNAKQIKALPQMHDAQPLCYKSEDLIKFLKMYDKNFMPERTFNENKDNFRAS